MEPLFQTSVSFRRQPLAARRRVLRAAKAPSFTAALVLLSAIVPATARAQGFTDVTKIAGITHVHTTAELVADLPGPAFMTAALPRAISMVTGIPILFSPA